MRNRRWICLLLAVLTLLACTACGVKTNDGASGDVRTLTDSKNRTVEVPKQVDRIVCVGVGSLRYSCYVGAADRVVGVEDYETKAGMSRLYNYVNFDKFKDLPVTGTNGEPYVEQIIDVAPQVIVMSAYASCDADELSGKTGIPVFVVPGSDTTLDDAAYETIRLLGELYGLETRAQELTKYLKGIQTDLDTRTAKIADDQKPSVYVGGVSFKGQHGFEGTEAGYGPFALIHASNLADTTGHFLTTEDFQRLISENAFVEYEEVYPGRFYGTLKSEVSKILESGHNLILDIDVKGGLNVKKQYPEALSLFFTPPSIEVLRERLVGRATDDIDTINQRVDKAAFELTFAPQYDVNIVNDDLDKAVAKTREVIESFISK